MSFQTPDPNAQANDPAAWVTTGTPVPGSSDPKTVEMLATIRRLHLEYDPFDSGNTGTVGPKWANYLLLPDGTVTDNLSIATFSVQWMADRFEQQLASKRFLILYWGPRMPTSTVWAVEDTLASAEAEALSASPGAETGRVTTITAEVQAVREAQTAAATTVQPTEVTGAYAPYIAAKFDPATGGGLALPGGEPAPTTPGGAPLQTPSPEVGSGVPTLASNVAMMKGAGLFGLALLLGAAWLLTRRRG
jgi:hypothetical protein